MSDTRDDINSLADRIGEISAHSAVLEHERLTLLRRFDALGGWQLQGARSCAHWLSWRIGLRSGAAREQVRVARALGSLPAIDGALAQGKLSYSKVRALTRVATAENDALLAEMAQHATADELEKICRKFQTVARGSGDEELARPHERRSFERRDLDSGFVRFTIQVRPEEAAIIEKAVQGAIAAAFSAQDAGRVSAETPRRVDAFVAICTSYLASPSSDALPRPHEVSIHVDQASFEGELEDGSPLSAESVRRLSCDTPIVDVVERDGKTLDVGRRRRTIPAAMRRALDRRDGSCRFPGCTNRLWVDGHHVKHWSQGGATKLDNLILLCGLHHRCVHEGGFSVQPTSEGFRFLDPSGVEIRVPAVQLPSDIAERLAEQRRLCGVGPRTGFPQMPLDECE